MGDLRGNQGREALFEWIDGSTGKGSDAASITSAGGQIMLGSIKHDG